MAWQNSRHGAFPPTEVERGGIGFDLDRHVEQTLDFTTGLVSASPDSKRWRL